MHPQEQKPDGGHSGVRLTDPRARSPEQPFTWTGEVAEAVALAPTQTKANPGLEFWGLGALVVLA